MSAGQLPLLLCTNGNQITCSALDYGVWLAGLLHSHVTLLGVIEDPADEKFVNKLVTETEQKLKDSDIPYDIRLDHGMGPVVIARHTSTGPFLTVLGPLGRPAWRRVLQGRSFRRVLEKVATPVLYVRQGRQRLNHILVCLGGLDYSESVQHLCLYLAKIASSRLTLLHVVEPVTLEYPISKEIHEHWQHILETDTPQGKILRKAFEEAQSSGLPVQFKVRHGNPVHEILEEVKSGEYDLIGMGTPQSAHSLRHLYLPNVTAEVAEGSPCPVLSVRLGFSLV